MTPGVDPALQPLLVAYSLLVTECFPLLKKGTTYLLAYDRGSQRQLKNICSEDDLEFSEHLL